MIFTEICSFSYEQILSENRFNNENGEPVEDEKYILTRDCKYNLSPNVFMPTQYYSFSEPILSSKEFPSSESFSSIKDISKSGTFSATKEFSRSGLFTSSNSFLTNKNDQFLETTATMTATPKNVIKILYSMSYSLTYIKRKSVSYSISYVHSNAFEISYDFNVGTYTMFMTQRNYQSYFPYIIYFLSPVYIKRNITVD